jgi:hypothetical protein
MTLIPTRSLDTGLSRTCRLRRDDRLGGDLVGLEPLDDLVDDLCRRELPGAERDVEVLRLLETRLADDLREHGRALELAVRELLRLQRLVERSRPFASVSPRVSRWYHWRILLRARDEVTSASQSRDGPRPDFEVRISTKSPLRSR